MATQKTHDLVLKVGEYTDSQGNAKSRTKNIGAVMRREDGSTFLALDSTVIAMETQYIANPERKSQIFVSVYPANRDESSASKRPAQSSAQQAAPKQQAAQEFNDEIPF